MPKRYYPLDEGSYYGGYGSGKKPKITKNRLLLEKLKTLHDQMIKRHQKKNNQKTT